ncbi:heme ABC transporter ATP-binding protein [Aurantimonas sp. VKM B-3413]|uniref:heme ABC transporter ATP-binding protein n=1 Tax=Aurantimonas sp. VKM B-3413 TaxID=2779401 RepID=UPI0021024326|nr:heme ABC transporter ATP-binding protein [Aurantimonas sp. VKM B-3413]MCB8836708.1 heme ABC transporter ATP-binding protein [Aurantimonas sp. VKM B-3413]
MTIEIDQVSIMAGGRRIVGPVCTRLHEGALTTIVGPNGAGKSSLVKAMSGEIRPASGSVRLHGRDIAGIAPATLARQRAVLPQATAIAFPFTVFEIVSLGLRVRAGLDGAARQRLVEGALAAVDLEAFGDRAYQRLSGGEQQRVQLARILCQIGEPVERGQAKLLILDEPTSSLDVRHQLDVLKIARRFAENGAIVVAVLHDLNLAASFSDRILVMSEGSIVADDAPTQILKSGILAHIFRTEVTVIEPPGWSRPAILPDLSRI